MDTNVAIAVTADVTLRNLAVVSCEVGIVASAPLTLDNVSADRVHTGAIVEGSTAIVSGAWLRPGSITGGDLPAGLARTAVLVIRGARLEIFDSEVMNTLSSLGIYVQNADLHTERLLVDGGALGVYSFGSGTTTVGSGTVFRGQHDVRMIPGTAIVADGPTLAVNDVLIEDTDSCAIGLVDATASLTDLDLRDVGSCGVYVNDSTCELAGDISMQLADDALYALFVTAGAEVRVPGTMTSSGGSDDLIHISSELEGTTVDISGDVETIGGNATLYALLGGDIAISGTISGTPRGFGIVVDRATATIANAEITMATREGAAAHVFAGSLQLSASALQGGVATLWARDSSIDVRSSTLRGGASFGVYLDEVDGDAQAMFNSTQILDGEGVGLLVRGGAADFRGGLVGGNAGRGIEAQREATLAVLSADVRNNGRFGVSFFDASGSVGDTVFGGTLPVDAQANEILVAASARIADTLA